MYRSVTLRLAAVALLLAACGGGARAQSSPTAIVVAACGTPPVTYNAGISYPLTMNTSGQLCNAASGGGGGSGTVTSVGETFTGGLITVAGSPVTVSGTFALTVAGTSGGIPYFASASTWATSAALAANALVIGGGAGAAPASTTTGTGVVTALGVNVGSAGAFVVNGGVLGTPSGGTATNLTGLPIATGISGLGTGVATALAVTANASGGAALVNGAQTAGNCLKWSATGVQDAGAACGGGTVTLTVGTTATSGGGAGQLMFDSGPGTFQEATGLTATNTSLTITGGSLVFTGNQSAAAWTTNGLRLKGVSGTLTDTTSSGTVAAAYTDVLGGNTIAASSATTYTEYDAVHFKAPVAGTNVTFTNGFALGADSVSFGTSNPFRVTAAGAVTANTLVMGGAADPGFGAGEIITNGNIRSSADIRVLGSGGNKLILDNTGNVNITNTGSITFVSGDAGGGTPFVFITAKATANLQLGKADAASIVAQTLGVQSIAAGATNTAGALWTLTGSLSTGSGASGDIAIQTGGTGAGATAQNTATTAILIKGATQNVRLPQITSDAALTDSTVCQDTTNHALFSGSGTLGICLGTSSARYKHDVSDLGLGLHAIMGLQPKRYFLDRQHGDPTKPYYGFLAEDGVGVLPELVGNDNVGRPNTFDYLGIVPILVRAVQEQQVEIETLRRMVR